MDLGLENKIVIVTGATGEIGQSICMAFLKEDAIVVPFYRNQSKLDKFIELCKENNYENKIYPIKVNISDSVSITEAVNQIIKKFKRIDVLVNSVGLTNDGPFLLMDEENWDKVINTNLSYVVKIIRIVLKHMFKAKSGSIVNISSILGQAYGRGAVAYSVSKAGIDRLTESLALEVGKKGVRVNAVCPGVIETKMSKSLTYYLLDKVIERTALQRVGTPDEVSNAVLFLASNKTSSFISGHKLKVDGGLSI